MGAKTESRLINEIECASSTMLMTKSEKQIVIIKNVKALRKHGFTKSWWYACELPLYLKRNNLTNRLTIVKDSSPKESAESK